MDHESQIFIQIYADKDPVEFLLTKQPLDMIKGGFVTKDDIRNTVEMGKTYDAPDIYSLAFIVEDLEIVVTLEVRIDPVLYTIENVEVNIM